MLRLGGGGGVCSVMEMQRPTIELCVASFQYIAGFYIYSDYNIPYTVLSILPSILFYSSEQFAHIFISQILFLLQIL